MPYIDPGEEIRRLIDDEGWDRDDAVEFVKADLKQRKIVAEKPWQRSKNRPHYRWTPEAQRSGNIASRRAPTGRPRKSMT
jgi:hypothetical protein